MAFRLQTIIFLSVGLIWVTASTYSQETKPTQVSYNQKTYNLYPAVLDQLPNIPSPFATEGGLEIVVAFTKDEKYALIPVTVENGSPLHYSRRVQTQYGKDRQLQVDSGDFPALAKTGLHSESHLDGKDMI